MKKPGPERRVIELPDGTRIIYFPRIGLPCSRGPWAKRKRPIEKLPGPWQTSS